MPNYEYKCKDCGELFEIFQRMTEEPLRVCQGCGGSLRRLFGTGAGIIFKGSGFYETDYRKDEYKKKAAAENKPASQAKEKTTEKNNTESKPEASKSKSPESKTEAAAS